MSDKEQINRQCQDCFKYELDDGSGEICECDDCCPLCLEVNCLEDCDAYEDEYL